MDWWGDRWLVLWRRNGRSQRVAGVGFGEAGGYGNGGWPGSRQNLFCGILKGPHRGTRDHQGNITRHSQSKSSARFASPYQLGARHGGTERIACGGRVVIGETEYGCTAGIATMHIL